MKLREYLLHTKPKELAELAGVSPAVLYYFLNKKRGLSALSITKIIKATNGQVTYEEIMSEIEEIRSDNDRHAR